MSQGAVIAALAAFLAVGLATLSISLFFEWWSTSRQQRGVRQQLDALQEASGGAPISAGDPLVRHRVAQDTWLAPVTKRLSKLRDIQLLIQQAGMEWTLQSFLFTSAGLAFGFALVTIIISRSWPAALAMACLGGALPYFHVNRRRNKRIGAFEEQLPEAIDLIGRALRAGHPLTSGLKMAADESPEPIGGELRRAFEEQRFGLPLEDSLLGISDRVDLVDVRILMTAILIQREVGGNLAEILDNLAAVVRARFTIQRQVRVYTAQGRLTGYLLACLPLGLGGILFMMNPSYMSILWKDQLGRLLVGFGMMMQFIGFLWIRKIVDIEV